MRKSSVHAFLFSFVLNFAGAPSVRLGAVDDASARSRPLCWSDAVQLKANKTPQVSEPRSLEAMGAAKVRVVLCLNDVCAGLRRETDVVKVAIIYSIGGLTSTKKAARTTTASCNI